MRPFWKRKKIETPPETGDTKDGPNPADIKRWINCGIVTDHQARLFIGTRSSWILCALRDFIFECQDCGFRIRKTERQLSSKERKALIKLGYRCLNKGK